MASGHVGGGAWSCQGRSLCLGGCSCSVQPGASGSGAPRPAELPGLRGLQAGERPEPEMGLDVSTFSFPTVWGGVPCAFSISPFSGVPLSLCRQPSPACSVLCPWREHGGDAQFVGWWSFVLIHRPRRRGLNWHVWRKREGLHPHSSSPIPIPGESEKRLNS